MKLTSLKDLAELIPSQIPEKAAKAVYLEDDPYQNPIYQRIIKALSSGKSRTMQEIQDFVRPVEQDPSVVEQAVFFMRNNTDIGESVESPKLYWLTKPHSQMFRGTKIIGYAPRKQKEPDILMNTTKVLAISCTDELDVAIWKAMQDRKPRSASEISKILVEYQFEGSVVRNRVISLMMKKTWFDRIEKSGHDTQYVLKKTCKKPESLKAEEEHKEPTVNETPESLEDLKGTVFDKAVEPTKTVSEPLKETKPELLPTSVDNKASEGSFYHPSELFHVYPEDSVNMKIYKVMADGKYYTRQDVVTLIQASGATNTSGSINASISSLKTKKQWFQMKFMNGEKYYRLKPSVIDGKTGKTMLDLCKANAEAKLDGKTVVDTPVKDISVTAVEVSKPKASSVVFATNLNTKLFEVVIRLKGVEVTLDEAREIVALGRTMSNMPGMSSSLVQVKQFYTIKGVDFTLEEIQSIATGLKL